MKKRRMSVIQEETGPLMSHMDSQSSSFDGCEPLVTEEKIYDYDSISQVSNPSISFKESRSQDQIKKKSIQTLSEIDSSFEIAKR